MAALRQCRNGARCRHRDGEVLDDADDRGEPIFMELADLNQDERTVLVGLLKVVVMSDGNVSEDELEQIEAVVEAWGEPQYQQTLDMFEKRFLDEKSFRAFLTTIGRQEARELIYATIADSAAMDAIEGKEADLLDWLAGVWKLDIQTEDAPSA
ncbi:MAG TPA: hypothetical protein VFH73_27975 [Polyangia bacterium]|nr:hypothetical protein [Polyangia bacterium]